MIYLDNAATSFPKPKQVSDAVAHHLNEIGGNPGRAAHAPAREAGRVIDQVARQRGAVPHTMHPKHHDRFKPGLQRITASR